MQEIELLPDDSFDPYDDPRYLARRKLTIPAFALIAIGILSVIAAIYASLMSGSYREFYRKTEFNMSRNRDTPPVLLAISKVYFKMNTDLLPLTNGLYAVFGAMIAIGGYQMLSLSSRWMCMTSAILSCIPFASCCCCIGIVFGIWALVVMSMPDVRAAFIVQAQLSRQK